MAKYSKMKVTSKTRSTGGRKRLKAVNGGTSKRKRRSQLVNVGGNIFDKKLHYDQYLIYSESEANGIAINKNTNVEAAAIEYLISVSCLPTEGELTSLSDDVTEIIDNPAIRTEINKKPTAISTLDKFPNIEDPFYNLDVGQSLAAAQELLEEKNKDANNYTKLAGAMAAAMGNRR